MKLDNIDHYSKLKGDIEKYLKFGQDGAMSIRELKAYFYKTVLPDDMKPAHVPSLEAMISKLHANASYEFSMAECAYELANEMYNHALSTEMNSIMANFQNKRIPAADKIKSMAENNIDIQLKLQKLYASQAIKIMRKVINHLDYLSSRLKNAVMAMKVDAYLEKGQL